MPIEQIGTALGAVNTAIGIGKAVIDAKGAVEKATLNLQIADLMTSLAEAKSAIVDSQERVREKEKEIEQLNDALTNKAAVKKSGDGYDGYYELDAEGRPRGAPFCMRCYEVDHKLVHIARGARTTDEAVCPACKSRYNGHRVPTLRPT